MMSLYFPLLGGSLLCVALWYGAQCSWDLASEVTSKPDWRTSLIHGYVAPGWEPVRSEFEANFERRGEVGAAVAVYHRGQKVVDLWGGYRDRANQLQWESDTLVSVFSSTKGATSFATLLQLSRDKLRLDDSVASFWPAFAANGKDNATVRQLLGHTCGLAAITKPISLDTLADPNATYEVIAEQEMEWPVCGDRLGYMATTLGFYESAVVHFTDVHRRSIGRFLREEIFEPLNLSQELMVGVPDSVPERRLAWLETFPLWKLLFHMDKLPVAFVTQLVLRPWSYVSRAFKNPSELGEPWRYNLRDMRRLELPASNGHSTARALARLYDAAVRAINTDMSENPLGLSKDVLAAVQEMPTPPRETGNFDQILFADNALNMGYMKPPPIITESSASGEFGSDGRAFGSPGAGGSFSFADPTGELSYSYVMNKMQTFLFDDPREVALRARVWECANVLRMHEDLPPLRAQLASPVTRAWLAKHPEQSWS